MTVSRYRTTGSDFKTLRALIYSRPGVIAEKVANELENIGAFAVDTMQDTIERSTTKTGAAQQAKGLRSTAGRIRGDAERKADKRGPNGKSMIDSVSYKVNRNIRTSTTSRAKNNLSLRYGWLNGTPGYVWFQEHGTSNGVKGMNALGEADLFTGSLLKRYLI